MTSVTLHKRGQKPWPPDAFIFQNDLSEDDEAMMQYGIAVWSYDVLRTEMIPHLYSAIWELFLHSMPQEPER